MHVDLDQAQPPPPPRGAVLLAARPVAADPELLATCQSRQPELEPPRTPSGQPGPVGRAVELALDAAGIDGRDQGAAELARRLARDLDHMATGSRYAAQLGRALAGVLDQLHLTPAARASVDAAAEGEASPLTAIRDQGARPLRAVES